MEKEEFTIQELCEQTGIPRRTIHFYIQQELLPPPKGTGLGARYSNLHMLCLRLIPPLRQQGLRLDDIRKQFKMLDFTGLQTLFAQTNQTVKEQSQEVKGQTYIHYRLPGGIALIIPNSINQLHRNKINELIRAANRIF